MSCTNNQYNQEEYEKVDRKEVESNINTPSMNYTFQITNLSNVPEPHNMSTPSGQTPKKNSNPPPINYTFLPNTYPTVNLHPSSSRNPEQQYSNLPPSLPPIIHQNANQQFSPLPTPISSLDNSNPLPSLKEIDWAFLPIAAREKIAKLTNQIAAPKGTANFHFRINGDGNGESIRSARSIASDSSEEGSSEEDSSEDELPKLKKRKYNEGPKVFKGKVKRVIDGRKKSPPLKKYKETAKVMVVENSPPVAVKSVASTQIQKNSFDDEINF